MPDERQGVPVTWRELRASGIGERKLEEAELLIRNGVKSPNSSPDEVLGSQAPDLAAVCVLLGRERLNPLIDEIRDYVDKSIATFREAVTWFDTLGTLRMLSAANVLDCAGFLDERLGGVDAAAALEHVQKGIGKLGETYAHTAGLAAAATNNGKLVPKLVGGGKLPAKFTAGETFGFNVPGFVRYLAAGGQAGAAPDEVDPAWRDFVTSFPHKLAARTLDWHDLLWAARARYLLFEGRPPAQVGDAVRELVESA